MSKPLTISGSDYLTPISVQKLTTTAASRIIYTAPISPSFFKGTRLTQFSNLYERYVFNKFTVRYVPAVPTTLACQLLAYIDTDPSDDATTIVDAAALFRQAVAQTGSRQWNFIGGMTIPLAVKAGNQLYYTGETRENERFNVQGRLYILQLTDPLNVNGLPIDNDSLACGSLFMDWNCTFSTPQINPETALYAGASTAVPPTLQSRTLQDGMVISYLEWDGLEPNAIYAVASNVFVDTKPAMPISLRLAPVDPKLPLGPPRVGATDLLVQGSTYGVGVGSTSGTNTITTVFANSSGVAALQLSNQTDYTNLLNWAGASGYNNWELSFARLFV